MYDKYSKYERCGNCKYWNGRRKLSMEVLIYQAGHALIKIHIVMVKIIMDLGLLVISMKDATNSWKL